MNPNERLIVDPAGMQTNKVLSTSESMNGNFVSSVGSFDVLLGRGTGPSMNQGNVLFRNTVEDLKASYINTPSRKQKKQIVHKIVRDIKAKKGRFLNKLCKSKIRSLGLNHETLYEIAPESVAIEKTKQAIRYVHYKKEPTSHSKSGSSSSSMDMEKDFSSGNSQASCSSTVDVDAHQDRVNGPAHQSSAQPKSKSPAQTGKDASPLSPSSVFDLNSSSLPPRPLMGMHPAILTLCQTSTVNTLTNLALLAALSNGGANLHPTVASLLLAQNQASLSLARDMEAAASLSSLPKNVSGLPMVVAKTTLTPSKK
ncbi:MAG: hypothetical protein SGBAC_003975, partial [Bacillariaceae sp.]